MILRILRIRKPDWDWRRWMKLSIWAVCVLAMVSLTINDIVPLFDEYRDENKNVATEVVIAKNRSVDPPTLVVCLPYYSRTLDKLGDWLWRPESSYSSSLDTTSPQQDVYEAMRAHSWDVWGDWRMLNTTKDVALIKYEGEAKIMKKLLAEADHGFPSLRINRSIASNWNQPLMDAVWRYIYHVTKLDRDLASRYVLQGNDSKNLKDVYFGQIGTVPNKVIDQLFSLAVDDLLISGDHIRTNRSSAFLHLERSPISIISDRLCIQIDPNITKIDIEAGEQHSYEYSTALRNEFQRGVQVYEDPSYLYSNDLSKPPLYESSVMDDRSAPRVYYEYVGLSYTVESKFIENRTGKVCSHDVTPAVCLAKLHTKASIDHCRCVPFAYRFLADQVVDLPYCNFDMYESCLGKLLAKKEHNRKYCNDECERTFYSWRQQAQIKTDKNVTQTTFVLDTMPMLGGAAYMEFTSVDKTSLQQFFSQLGGSIGLYLGLSGLSTAVAVIMLIEFASRRCATRKRANSKCDPDEGARFAWGTLWIKGMWNIIAGTKHNHASTDHIRNEVNGLEEEIRKIKKDMEMIKGTLNEVLKYCKRAQFHSPACPKPSKVHKGNRASL